MLASLSLALFLGAASVTPADAVYVADETPIHLGISLRVANSSAMWELHRAQQDPRSPLYHRWITPQEFGERFGQPAKAYEQVAAWLEASGFRVTRSQNRIYIEAVGTANQATRLLDVHLKRASGRPVSVHVPDRAPRLPPEIAPAVLHISGLDTRVRFHHRLAIPVGKIVFGPQDLRRFYDVQPLLGSGYVGQGQQLVVLGAAAALGTGPSTPDITYFLQNLSDSSITYIEQDLPNPQNDVDAQPTAGIEYDLDVEMQSVGAPGADSVTLVLAPASEVFTAGPNFIVNSLPSATAVSVSLGECEPNVQALDQLMGTHEETAVRQLIVQGVMEGQTWSAASGDFGSDACGDGMTPSIDFPASIPEMVAMGGTELKNPPPSWDANGALAAYQQEVLWNDGTQGGAAGGGLSILFTPAPAYQQGLGFSARSVPDVSLLSGLPGVAVCATKVGDLAVVEGTSVAAPLSAGFFALVASRVGCRLGDVHGALYALGNFQWDGGTPVFHEITSGNNSFGGVTGVSAGPGFGPASGWGSLDVAAIAAAWPACPPLPDGGTIDAGPGPAYTQCGLIACDAGAVCTTVPEGPSGCVVSCPPQDAGTCGSGNVCSGQTVFDADGGGSCVPGCLTNTDCSAQPGTVCEACQELCVPQGDDTAHIGDGCTDATQCPTGAFCYIEGLLVPGGYCTETCSVPPEPAGCPCPSGSICSVLLGTPLCVASCTPGTTCSRSQYACQPQASGGGACLPACEVIGNVDTCILFGPGTHCDSSTGVCELSTDGGSPADAGTDAGTVVDSGIADSGVPLADSGTATSTSGCHCASGADLSSSFAGFLAFAAFPRARRRRGSS
jgi:hypothetical protein